MKVSIVIPVYNERRTIAKILAKVLAVKIPKEVIIIDDGSTDGTQKILKNKFEAKRNIKIFFHPKNLGKGAAIRTGLKSFSGDAIIIQDADLEYDPQDYHKLLEPIKQGRSEVVYGSRFLRKKLRIFGKNPTPMPFHWIGNKFLVWVTNTLYGNSLTDMETCYKVFTRKVAKKLKLSANRFDFEPEITAKILKLGYKIIEVSISHKPRSYKAGKKITWRDGIVALYTLLKYRFVE